MGLHLFHRTLEDAGQYYVRGKKDEAIKILDKHLTLFSSVKNDLNLLVRLLQEYHRKIEETEQKMRRNESIETEASEKNVSQLMLKIYSVLRRLKIEIKREE